MHRIAVAFLPFIVCLSAMNSSAMPAEIPVIIESFATKLLPQANSYFWY